MLQERFKLKIGVFLVIFKENTVLLSRRYNTGIGDGCHVLPMGGLEEGETVTEAIVREAFEEVNIILQPSALRIAHVMHRLHLLPDGTSFPQIDIFFIPSSYSGVITNNEPHKCDELKFYLLDNLPPSTEPFIKQALQCIQNGQVYSEIGWSQNATHTSMHLCDTHKSLYPHSQDASPAIYEVSGASYDYTRNADPTLVTTLMHLLEWKDTGRYLDIGCGSGNYTIALSNKGLMVEGIDLSTTMLQKAHNKANHIRWSQGDMRALGFESCSFDGAITINTLHYVRKTLVATFSEMRRILKPGGKLVIFAIGLEQCLQFWLGYYFPFFRDLGRQILASRDTLIDALTEAQFVDIQVEPFFVTEHTSDLFSYACKYRPHLFLDPNIRANMTPLQLPEYAEEIRIGCEKLQKDIVSGAIYRVIGQHESQLGEGLCIAAKNSV